MRPETRASSAADSAIRMCPHRRARTSRSHRYARHVTYVITTSCRFSWRRAYRKAGFKECRFSGHEPVEALTAHDFVTRSCLTVHEVHRKFRAKLRTMPVPPLAGSSLKHLL